MLPSPPDGPSSAEEAAAGAPGPTPPSPADSTTGPPDPAAGPAEGRRPRGPQTTTVVALAIAVVAILAGAALFLSGYSLGRQEATTPGTPVSDAQLFQPFWDTWYSITERYAGGTVDKKTLVEGAIKGMVSALGDPYSSYLTPEEYRQSLEGINGQFEGIGAEIGTKTAAGADSTCTTLGPDCRLAVVSPLDGSPAKAAGLQPGDIITAVDGASLDGLTTTDARDKIRGPKGTIVTLTIVRGDGEPFDVKITRAVIEQQEVTTKDLADGTVGYIRISGFSADAGTEFDTALRADLAKGQRLFVIDLRGDPGGFVDAARKIASEFIASGPIFWQEDASGNKIPTEAESGGAATDPSIRVTVLIDGGSASASEIVAGALQDTKRATLIGQQSFGKGTIQQWNQLGGDNGGFRLTVAKWLTPDQRWIHHIGLTPDIVVQPASNGQGDPVLDKALEVLGAPTALAPRALGAAA